MSEPQKVGSFSIGTGVRCELFGINPVRMSNFGTRVEIKWNEKSPVEIYKEKGDYTVYSDGTTITVERTPLSKPVENFSIGSGNIDFNNPEHVEWLMSKK